MKKLNMIYKRLEGKASRRRRRREIRDEANIRFIKAWGADKTTAEILTELDKQINPINSKWVTSKARTLREKEVYLPRRNYDGYTPTLRRNLHFNLAFAKFWKNIEKPRNQITGRTSISSEMIDYQLLEYIEPAGATTNQLLESVGYGRVTLLERLRRLEELGFIVCTLADYGGRGRGYLWNIN
jgi:DNA-binding HxlR family transcriptional regulator